MKTIKEFEVIYNVTLLYKIKHVCNIVLNHDCSTIFCLFGASMMLINNVLEYNEGSTAFRNTLKLCLIILFRITVCKPCYLLHIDASSQVALTASSAVSEYGCLDAMNTCRFEATWELLQNTALNTHAVLVWTQRLNVS